MRGRVLGPVVEDLGGLGQGHAVDRSVGIAAAGGEGGIEPAEPLYPAFSATGTGSPTGCSPATLNTAATAAFNSATVASRSSTPSGLSSGWPGASPAATTWAAASIHAPP